MLYLLGREADPSPQQGSMDYPICQLDSQGEGLVLNLDKPLSIVICHSKAPAAPISLHQAPLVLDTFVLELCGLWSGPRGEDSALPGYSLEACWVPLQAPEPRRRAQGSSAECATSPLALPGISRGHFAVTKLSTGARGFWVDPGMPVAEDESQSESAGKNSMGWALGTHLTLGEGQVPEWQSWDPWDSWGLLCPVPLRPGMQFLSFPTPSHPPTRVCTPVGQSHLFHIFLLKAYYVPSTLLHSEDLTEIVFFFF